MKRTVLKTVGKTGSIEFDEILRYLKEHLGSDYDQVRKVIRSKLAIFNKPTALDQKAKWLRWAEFCFD